MGKIGKIKNKLSRDKSTWILIIPILIVGALALMSFDNSGSMFATADSVARPLELSFSDVLLRASDIKTMEIRGNDATGVLKDGTKYNATITYDPELLTKIADSGASISIDSTRPFMERMGFWLPVILWIAFFWFLFFL